MIKTTLILAHGKDIDWNEQKRNAQNEIICQSDSKVGTEADMASTENNTNFFHGLIVDENMPSTPSILVAKSVNETCFFCRHRTSL